MRTSFDRGWVQEPLYQLAPLDWEKFPAHMRPDAPGAEELEAYSPRAVGRFAPKPPELEA